MEFIKRLRALYLYKSIIWDMSIRQLKIKYSGSMLGIWWAIIIPLILAVCINIIFSNVFKFHIQNFTLFLLAGLIPWIFFSSTISEVTNSFLINSPLIKQSIAPREAIPIALIIANFLNFIIGFFFLLPFFLISNFKVISVLPVLIIVLIFNLFFILGFGIFVASFNVLARDLAHFLSIGLMIWFWITPIFYSIDMIKFPYRLICLFNPVTYYIISYQQILFNAESPKIFTLSIAFLISILFFIIGYSFFLKKEQALLKRI